MLPSCHSAIQRLSKTVAMYVLVCLPSCVSGQQAPNVSAPPSQPIRVVEAHDYHDDRVRPPLIAEDCRGRGGIAISRLWLKVVSTGKSVVEVGEEFTVTVEIHNGSDSPMEIPVASSLREAEPSDPQRSYSWRTLGISLNGFSGQEPWQYTAGRAVLYGSKETGTLLRLNPSEWVVVRFPAKFKDSRYKIGTDGRMVERSIPVGTRLDITARPHLSQSGEVDHYDARSKRETATYGATAQGGGEWTHITLSK
jgi:hypothetical protein